MFIQNALLGDHNVCFYSSPKERQNVLFSNLKAGLHNGCSTVYIASEENIKQVQLEMRNFGLKIDDHKKLRILSGRQFYTPDGEFHATRVAEQVSSILDESSDRGFEGLYVSADASKVFDYLTKKGRAKEWLEYEKAIGRRMPFPLEGVCAYNINQVKSDEQVFLQLIQAHKNTITAKELKFVDNQKTCVHAIMDELEAILGEESTELVLGFLEKRFKAPLNQIRANIVDVNQGLELLLGDGATPIEKRILKKLHKKTETSNTPA